MADKTVQFNVKGVDRKLHAQLRAHCIDQRITLREAVECMIKYYLERKARES